MIFFTTSAGVEILSLFIEIIRSLIVKPPFSAGLLGITYVVPNSPAEKGGLKINDLIISINNERISNPADVVKKINQNNLKSTLKIKILRENIEYLKNIKPIDIYELKL